jgi:hypothetical protein
MSNDEEFLSGCQASTIGFTAVLPMKALAAHEDGSNG